MSLAQTTFVQITSVACSSWNTQKNQTLEKKQRRKVGVTNIGSSTQIYSEFIPENQVVSPSTGMPHSQYDCW